MKKILTLLFSLSIFFYSFYTTANVLVNSEIKKNPTLFGVYNFGTADLFAPCNPPTAAPTIDVQSPVCISGNAENGKAIITDYDASLIYLFSPTGPTVSASGEILNITFGVNYTVEADNGVCTSTSTSFTVLSWDDFDCDGDGVSNGQEIIDGTDPYDPCDLDEDHQVDPTQAWLDGDCDGDGVSNGQEIIDATNPLNPCTYIPAHQVNPSQAWLDGDCDGDGVTNGDELADGTDPHLSCDFVLSSQTLPPFPGWFLSDCDSDGVTNGDEISDGTDPLDLCDFILSSQTLNPSTIWSQTDCDGDGVANEDELTDGTDPLDFCDYNPANQGTPSQAWLDADCDGDGISNGTELNDSSDPLDSCDPYQTATPLANVIQPNCIVLTGEIYVETPIPGAAYVLMGVTPAVPADTNGLGEFATLDAGDYELTAVINNCESSPLLITIEQAIPEAPTFDITTSTCTDPASASIDNFNSAYTYAFAPNDGIGVDGNGNITNATIGVNYGVEVTNTIGCTSVSADITLDPELPTPDTPDLQIVEASCAVNGSVEVLDYDPSNTYVFTPSSGIFINNVNNKIMGATYGTTYTVKAISVDGCESGTASFVINQKLPTPSFTYAITQPVQCNDEGTVSFTFINVSDGTYTMSYTGGDFTVNVSNGTGVVNLPEGIYNNLVINNGDCVSNVGSTIQINSPFTPPVPIILNQGIDCGNELDGYSTMTNYDSDLTYHFTPTGPTIGSNGEINDANFGVSYTVTSFDNGCHSPEASFTNISWDDGDCDGDGVTNGDEVADGTDPQNMCDFVVAHQTLPPSQQWLDIDCDRDGVTNGDELNDGTNPLDPCDLIVASQTVPPNSAWINGDCDGDGVPNGVELTDGTDLFDPCDFILDHINDPSQAWLNGDCDGDGVSNGDEKLSGTNLLDPCDYDVDKVTLPQGNEWSLADCDGDGVTSGQELIDETDPFDPCDLVVANQTLPPSQDWLDGDCDEDGVTNGDEVAMGADIFDPCDPNICTLSVPSIFSPDGDGINDYWRVKGIENYPDNSLVIYNRWGNVVYEVIGYNNEWNGFSNSGMNVGGEELPTGTYYYILDTKNTEIGVMKGYIYLQR